MFSTKKYYTRLLAKEIGREKSDVNKIKLLLASGADMASPTLKKNNVPWGDDCNLLEYACANKKEDVAEVLIKTGFPLDLGHPIIDAIRQNMEGIAQLLIERGAPLNNTKILDRACSNKQENIVDLLLEKKAAMGDEVISHAVWFPPILKKLLAAGAKRHSGALITAATHNYIEALNILSKEQLDINYIDKDTPLTAAKKPDTIKTILAMKPDIDLKCSQPAGPNDSGGKTALTMATIRACERSMSPYTDQGEIQMHIECMKLLIMAGSHEKITDDENLTALDYARIYAQAMIIRKDDQNYKISAEDNQHNANKNIAKTALFFYKKYNIAATPITAEETENSEIIKTIIETLQERKKLHADYNLGMQLRGKISVPKKMTLRGKR